MKSGVVEEVVEILELIGGWMVQPSVVSKSSESKEKFMARKKITVKNPQLIGILKRLTTLADERIALKAKYAKLEKASQRPWG